MQVAEFQKNVALYGYSLKPFASSLARDKDVANDLVQETIFRALSSQGNFKDGTNLKAWMYVIMRNLFINEYRRTKNRKTVTMSKYMVEGTLTMSTVTNQGDTNIELENLSREINLLKNNIKVPFLMYHEGYQYAEIAKKCNVPIGTIKSRIHLARKELKQNVARY
jgi:RNA polymerase sigma factor (sigma-70 family)